MKYRILLVSQQTDAMEMCMCVTVMIIRFRCLADKVSITLQGLSHPATITVSPHQLFVSCFISDHIHKLDKLSGSILCSVETENIINTQPLYMLDV